MFVYVALIVVSECAFWEGTPLRLGGLCLVSRRESVQAAFTSNGSLAVSIGTAQQSDVFQEA